jgi:ankyrin repeat protein
LHLDAGILPDVPFLKGFLRPLHLAVCKRYLGISTQLLRAGANVDSIGLCNRHLSTPLQTAAAHGQPLFVKLLLSHRANPLGVPGTDLPPPLVLATRGLTLGHVEAAQLLQEAGSPTEEALREVLSGWVPSFAMVKALVCNRPVAAELQEAVCKVAARYAVEHDDLPSAYELVQVATGSMPECKQVLITAALKLAAEEDNPLAVMKLLKAAGSAPLQHVKFSTENFKIFSKLLHAGASCDLAAHEALVVKLVHEYENIRKLLGTMRREVEVQQQEIDQLRTIPDNLRQALFVAVKDAVDQQ